MDERGMPSTVAYTRRRANLLLSERGKDTVGENWVRKFVGRHDEIKAKYSRQYNYQRAKCEDPQNIQEWYDRVAATKQKRGILDEDVYNFDQMGFQMGVIATARVFTRSDRRGWPVLTAKGTPPSSTVVYVCLLADYHERKVCRSCVVGSSYHADNPTSSISTESSRDVIVIEISQQRQ